MLDHHAALMAMRNRLLTTEIAGTGVTTLAVVGNGYTRTVGSFVTDGFTVGMEVKPAGFADNTVTVIKNVEALKITTGSRTPQAAGAGRSLTVGIPEIRSWTNKESDPDPEFCYIEEDYVPGPVHRITSGPLGEFETSPMYILRLFGKKGVGSQALDKMAGGVLSSFPPRYALDLADGTVLRVNSNPGPYRGQVRYDEDGFAFVTVTIPFWVRTRNLI